ncbi:lipoprotein [Pseudoduganella plicata]|uniref:Lipoprotein n=2 Tax=Pseudoduganella plicata TaxID=321984 RepID=A0ABX5SFG5_9BURK|nr:lipoprotein [Pseudoduganella plicata]QBQ37985.1 hypothetical protein E1742_18680 [Pseudoduganella plicata]
MLHSKGSVHTEILIVKFTLALPVAAVIAAVFLSGCGQTGPLYMPKPPNKPAAELGKPGTAPPSAPVPSTPPASQQ